MFRHTLLFLTFLLPGFLGPLIALPLTYVQSSIQARATLLPDLNMDSGQLQQLSISEGPIGYSISDANGVRFTSMSATAGIGHLTASASASTSWINFLYAADASTVAVRFLDTITITSPNLPVGTFVSLMGTLTLTDNLFAVAGTCCSNVIVNGGGLFSGLNLSDQAFGQTIGHTQQVSAMLSAAVGTPFTISGLLSVNATSANSAQQGASSGSGDAFFTLDLLTPGTGCVSASGGPFCDVGTNTPEPGTFATLGVPLLVALLLRRRRGR